MAPTVREPGEYCSDCGHRLEHANTVPRVPCEKCGSLVRTIYDGVREELHITEYIKTHSKHREGGRKVVREVISGDDYYRKEDRWTYIYRLIDRAKDWPRS